jgi:hypothetical protein
MTVELLNPVELPAAALDRLAASDAPKIKIAAEATSDALQAALGTPEADDAGTAPTPDTGTPSD